MQTITLNANQATTLGAMLNATDAKAITPVLSFAQIENAGGIFTAYATDRYLATRYTSPTNDDEFSKVLLPGDALKFIATQCKKGAMIQTEDGENFRIFAIDKLVMTGASMSGKFGNTAPGFPDLAGFFDEIPGEIAPNYRLGVLQLQKVIKLLAPFGKDANPTFTAPKIRPATTYTPATPNRLRVDVQNENDALAVIIQPRRTDAN